MTKERVIFHCDCNSFYASVELLAYPHLKELPVAVSGSTDMRHGIILAKNEAAKKYGVKTAQTVWQAKKKCPQLQLLRPNRSKYTHYSRVINEIYGEYTDCVEPFGIDESWLDMSGSWQLFGASPKEVADILRQNVLKRTGLSISVGVSFNKIFAKLGSDYKKPNATTLISPENYKAIVWPMPVGDLLYVGGKMAETLKEVGIDTIGKLAAADEAMLQEILGKQGPQIIRYARGDDDALVRKIGEREPVKSVGNGTTFSRDLLGHADVHTATAQLADEVAQRLRSEKLFAHSLQVQIKNPQLKVISRQKNLPYSSNLAKDLAKIAMEIIGENWDYTKPIRMLTLTAQSLTPLPMSTQISLFEEAQELNPKREKLEHSIDAIRGKFGKQSIRLGGVLQNDIGFSRGAQVEEAEEKYEYEP